MRPKHVFAILLLASLGLVAVLFVRARHNDRVAAIAAAPAVPVVRDEVLVATRPLPQGLLLRAQDTAWRPQPGAPVQGQIVRPSEKERATNPESDEEARATVYGAAVRKNLAEGAPIRRADIVKPGDRDFLATVLTQGDRALTIPSSGAAGLMFPGDHVDVMLTQSFRNEDAPLTRRSVSETVVEDLRVLAIDYPPKGRPGPITVTLEVKPTQAEKINVAEELGKLSLTLRSLDEPVAAAAVQPATPAAVAQPAAVAVAIPASPPAPPPTWAGDVSPALSVAMPPPRVIQAEKPAVKVMRGGDSIETRTR